ncbi:1,4-alpha-glucan branching protein [Bradyrhizobium guangdongense]|uniref:alpha amylase C-terminal domain-containing protein n=1 Tax=Bradyrhizobium guangdongense TaxID=1325090 RepID=UPI00112DBE0D|nr:alpha amylase C-terminal domain-containing protein [Bradyrhizobium guangdongense]TPQ28551.1 1,4-alpha-glucan branching protein [Bradyrhizobium guangdongense]
MGATVRDGGTHFRVWAPVAEAVHVALVDPTAAPPNAWRADATNMLARDASGFWSGFFAGVGHGWEYRYWTKGPSGEGYKRDPRAVELELENYPDCNCRIVKPRDYPWHDEDFVAPRFNDLIIYQFHIGVFYAERDGVDIRANRVSKFLDVVDRIEHLALLGVNAIQPLPVAEWQGETSRGYNNTDFFSPEMDYCVPPANLGAYLSRINAMLGAKGKPPLSIEELWDQRDQLKAMVDLCHLYGLAVIGDVVYNHAGGPLDPQSMRFFDRPWNHEWWDPDSYFVAGEGWAGGRIFDYATDEVRAFLIDNAIMYLDDFHFDGLRYDEVTVIAKNGGQRFCRDITSTLRYRRPAAVQIAEYWDWDRALPVQENGLGFDAAWNDGLRGAIRSVLGSAAQGASASLNLDPVRDALRLPPGYPAMWKAVVHLENHDIVDADRDDPSQIQLRIPALAGGTDRRNWYARSRSRVASTLLLTAPGIPMLFMGQEFMEDKPWHNNPARSDLLIYWDGLKTDPNMRDFLRFMQELGWLRRSHPALRSEGCNPFYVHNQDRVIAVQRWVEGMDRDVVVVASFNETTHYGYRLPCPVGGRWFEVFNSEAYDNMPAGGGYNTNAAGNPGGIVSDGPSFRDQPNSAMIDIPANGALVFARDRGDAIHRPI